ncbi:LytR C-terminal domain-containing protein [Streptomyces sp. NPDC086077]|uniref:LytR C-terminal domain-containing protein n=1 Tax=Streptomyces sp. NPDC086077 TaxID=3154862 RepID=UPI003424DD77
MGGQYRITGDKYPRMRPPRRRGRLVLVVTGSVVVIGVLSWGTLQLVDVFTGGGDSASAAGTKAGCATKASPSPSAAAAVALPKPGAVTVNVLNATTRSGLAKKTADELKKRGFRIGEVGNAPKQWDKKVKGTGLLIGPTSALNTALPVLATQLPGAERSADRARKGVAVDLIIGNGFKELAKKPAADRALATLTAPQSASTDTKKSC